MPNIKISHIQTPREGQKNGESHSLWNSNLKAPNETEADTKNLFAVTKTNH